ncbi:hypothetical protein V6U90_18480 [Micromonospora sp. CPCC 206060]|uniref:hypothetical protein n=1 Tax=Micromonospora sp. CPCC 206060 TaxID=3122406 RepID=UPI002FF20E02
MSQPEEAEEKSPKTDPILAPPTANPDRVRVPPEGLGGMSEEGEPGRPGRTPEEEDR